jgi:hypothetical protein
MQVPFVAEPVEGWRAWHLSLDRFGPSLDPIGRGRSWSKGSATIARCWRHRRHRPPIAGCTCGLYAVPDRAQLRRARSPAVVGTVALWGRVVQHASGWRGEYGYPQRIALVCHVCLFQRDLALSQPDRVVLTLDGNLVPLCDHHLAVASACAMRICEVRSTVEVLRQVLDSYSVEHLGLLTSKS